MAYCLLVFFFLCGMPSSIDDLQLCHSLTTLEDNEVVEGASAGFCDVWSDNFRGQCYSRYRCNNTCKDEEGYIYGGECLWKGLLVGMACMCIYRC
ncbi:hypothetical protein P3L10_020173 [Capsicum annuum]